MTLSNQQSPAMTHLQRDLMSLVEQLPHLSHGNLIAEVLTTLIRMSHEDIDRLDWKILRSSLQDLERGFQIFNRYRHVRKISVFGSARLSEESPAYQLAVTFAERVIQLGFMVMTGAGGGIMEAANKGAGAADSFGLGIQLPFEQLSNPFIEGDPKLIDFKYFFTRKLFFLRETDAIALFPGGFGTQDEAFECLTLTQTGKSPPIPMVLIDVPGGRYWQDWDAYLKKQLTAQGLISPEDHHIYTITDNIETACAAIAQFYRVYHSSRYVGDQLVMRLNCAPTSEQINQLNQEFADILVQGKIVPQSTALPAELQAQEPQPQQTTDGTEHLPRLVFHFNQRDHGRLYQLIAAINNLVLPGEPACHPERK
ncbi:cytochrome D ubiquinol oxidase subunit II [Synechococcales cyanobacterium C]|uniref:Cytochrome D ubiquinol oxidase subunit II n=1 Tax=Petrachloros mirabilis ULC683 TaxID=2781853 RepID=A0A8K2A1M2_9CYAN|nr:LOG family protein [Petrachloros mirabilis]NCJ08172.1 cytochrome D ubiquinol oxidase subunit II [Petrachloros mirabilis ULC683]